MKGEDGDGLSAIEPKLYLTRFQLKMADILGVEDMTVRHSMDLITQQNVHMDVDPSRESQISLSIYQSSITSVGPHNADRQARSFLGERGLQSVGQNTEEHSGMDYHL